MSISSAGLKYWLPKLTLQAYEQALALIPDVVWLGQTVRRRLEWSQRFLFAVNAAVAAAISAGELSRAVEWFGIGRTIVWGQISQLRTLSIDELRFRDQSLADKFLSTSQALEEKDKLSEKSNFPATSFRYTNEGPEEEARRRHSLAFEYKAILEQIRKLDGFENFLRPLRFEELTQAIGDGGPVVLINVDKARCDALILHRSRPVNHVHLKDLTYEDALSMRSTLIASVDAERGQKQVINQREVEDLNLRSSRISRILKHLWLAVAEPILAALKETLIRHNETLPHITWCPSGPLVYLPLHASGDYTSKRRVFDAVVSSYTPNIAALSTRRQHDSVSLQFGKSPTVLAISQTDADGYSRIPGAKDEVLSISKYVPGVSLLDGEHATISAVMDLMDKHTVIHLACHGVQDAVDPTKSAFVLSDGKLTLADLMKKKHTNGALAFLSACETATDDMDLPDEVMHLAAGMLSVGYKSVVATMWSIKDKDACIMAGEFYRRLVVDQPNKNLDTSTLQASYALHYSVETLREEVGETNYEQWMPYVHYG